MGNVISDPRANRLEMVQIHKRFGATVALAGVDLAVRPGEVHAIVGENGAGKSTLMKVLGGAIQADAGSMRLDGAEFRPRHPAQGRAAGVAIVYQELSLAPHLTVAENVMLGAEPTIGPFLRRRRMRELAADALRQIGQENLPLDARAVSLSIAEQQLVEIARSLAPIRNTGQPTGKNALSGDATVHGTAVCDSSLARARGSFGRDVPRLQSGCHVLVLDEPTSSLGRGDVVRLFELIRRLQAKQVSVLYISHVLEEVQEISDRVTVLRDGAVVGTVDTAGTPTKDLVHMMVGRAVENLYPRSHRTPGEVVLELKQVAGSRWPVDASLTLRRGEVVGIAGLVGAGRTEMLRAVFGLDSIQRGELVVHGVTGWGSPTDRWAQAVGFVSENRKEEGLALGLSVQENVTLPRLDRCGRFALVTDGAQSRACAPWLAKLSVKCRSAGQRIGELSGGNQQKAALARLMFADSDVWLLDEPTRGIDVASKAQIYQLIDELAVGDERVGRGAKAVLMVSSYLPELLGVCDRIAVMHRGRLGPAWPVGELDEHRLMQEMVGSGGE